MHHNDKSAIFKSTFAAIQAASTVVEAIEVFRTNYGIDFIIYPLCQTPGDAVDTPFVRTTYPDRLQEGLNRMLPFHWREVEVSEAAYEFCADVNRHGLGDNFYSLPINAKSRRALLSLNSSKRDREWSTIVSSLRSEWTELAFFIHEKATFELHGGRGAIQLLGGREVECPPWSVLGKAIKDIGIVLELSDHTVRSYLKSAGSSSAAIAQAAHLRLIPYGSTAG
ncbi:autoinducer binding domain-containing protein [Phyllobacterium sp. KW56]|uniref:autoinducer binding domain-containing protein n=1 Tax=Phyllobacterium chamaecytisi TaxID=2876082 RepID=UPI001CCEC708|nr:autoinducer binding domain-containing protein [Phyllobacterium sp. KW56]MBZ9603090.1 autoinducer binding domain-containing protein [Phyllobacterium sp. KW56]